MFVFLDELFDGLDASSGSETVLRSIHAVVDELVDGGSSYVHAGVGRCIIDEYLSVGVGNPSVGEDNVHHVADVLTALWHKEVASRLCDNLRWVVESCHVHVENLAQTAGAATDTVGQMEPSLRSFYRVWTLAVLNLHDGVVVTGVDNFLFLNLGVGDIVDKSPADATA